MAIDKISFVGVDERTDLRELKTLADQSVVKLEFGILYSESKKGNRYPSQSIIDRFASIYNGDQGYHLSLHLCGTSVDKFLNRDSDLLEAIFYFDERTVNVFDAIQLNFTLKPERDVEQLVKDAIKAAGSINSPEIIFQANKSKQRVIDHLLTNEPNYPIRLLYDGSGGFGRTISKIDKPFKNYYTGYAGGINPETIHKIAYDVEMVSGPTNVYIDMESGVREKDWFSIDKCKKIIECVNALKTQSIWDKVS